ncbi:hypothetical protein D8M04_13000 [Oceanobacillus piezotolerans]|uniref:Beta-carotene 15,15'-monooxygenase n=1 Tax=Oceanobacillus piezotolerans TaxID=2448030 RepID=A0A498D5C9_9BACI|nr:hypothetical protein [Oceanobacillus piezotolerans]RLL43823.1 hypothetical protein D8M04_13000 [Oceanobacillus piezotolerans]
MTTSFSINQVFIGRILIFLMLILVPNLLIMQGGAAGPVNDVLGLGTAIDLVVVLPIVLFFFGSRKRGSVLVLFFLMFLGLLLANWIIPSEANGYLSYFNYSIITLEALIIMVEVLIFAMILRKLPAFLNNFETEKNTHYHFLLSFTASIQRTFAFKNSKLNKYLLLLRVLATDIAAIYYSIFSWRRKAPVLEGASVRSFTFHKDGAYLGVFLMLVHAMLIEIIAIHFIVLQFSHVFAWIITAIDIYALLFIIADYQAIRLSPVIVDREGIRFQKGIRQYGFISFQDMEMICENTKTVKEVDQDKKGISLALHGLEKEQIPYVVKLNKSVEVYQFFGKRKMVDSLYFKMDDSRQFIECVEDGIAKSR